MKQGHVQCSSAQAVQACDNNDLMTIIRQKWKQVKRMKEITRRTEYLMSDY